MWPSDGSLVPGPIDPITNRGRSGVEYSAATSLREPRGRLVQLVGLLGDVVLREDHAERAERGGLDRVHADVEVLAVHLADEVGAREHEVLVATLERFAAEVVRTELLALHPGTERAVEDQDAFAHGFEELVHWHPGYRSGFAPPSRHSIETRSRVNRLRFGPRTGRSARAHSSRSPELSP